LEEKTLLKYDQKIGITSFISAGAIFSKSLIKLSAGAATFSGLKLTTATTFALNLSTQIILTPLAGAFAFAMSAASYQKNKYQQKLLKNKENEFNQRFLKSLPYLKNMPQMDIQQIYLNQKRLPYIFSMIN
jgi:1-aminocyclopropane-1-carboxylate deaminase/D-cysteine desulfhydrase-like pyridoxal-dependent ACC family enzyme